MREGTGDGARRTGQDVSGTTALVALLGHPVGHSLSPAIHNAAFREQGIDAVYLACPVAPGRLAEAVGGLDALGALGANVTVPHKRGALDLAASASETARALGAANTLVRTPGGWHAHNTDVEGFLVPLAEHRDAVRGASVVVLGAGGAARAVVYAALAELEAGRVTVVARRAEQAEALADDLGAAGRVEVATFEQAGAAVHSAALVVNATPLGTGDGRSPLPRDTPFRADQIVYDLVYRPAETPLLRAARQRAATAIGGLPMLLGQAAASYRLWTGRDFPLDLARRVALDALRHD